MRFDFPSTSVELTINGVECTLDVGDAEMQDRLQEASDIARRGDLSDEQACVQASERLRGIVSAILGDEATDQIYKDVRPNLYKDVELVAFLRTAMNESGPTQRFTTTMNALDAVIGIDD